MSVSFSSRALSRLVYLNLLFVLACGSDSKSEKVAPRVAQPVAQSPVEGTTTLPPTPADDGEVGPILSDTYYIGKNKVRMIALPQGYGGLCDATVENGESDMVWKIEGEGAVGFELQNTKSCTPSVSVLDTFPLEQNVMLVGRLPLENNQRLKYVALIKLRRAPAFEDIAARNLTSNIAQYTGGLNYGNMQSRRTYINGNGSLATVYWSSNPTDTNRRFTFPFPVFQTYLPEGMADDNIMTMTCRFSTYRGCPLNFTINKQNQTISFDFKGKYQSVDGDPDSYKAFVWTPDFASAPNDGNITLTLTIQTDGGSATRDIALLFIDVL